MRLDVTEGAELRQSGKQLNNLRESGSTENISLQRVTAEGRGWFGIKAVKKKCMFMCMVVVQWWEACE